MRMAPAWGADPLDRNKFDRNSIEIPRYAQIERSFSGEAQGIVQRYMSGDLSRVKAMAAFKEALQDAENQAFVAGRRARGRAHFEITEAEADMLAGRHSRNMRYFSGFLKDIDSGKYDSGRNGPMTPMKRADLYAKSLWSLYTRGETTDWEEPENQNMRYYWVMDPDAEHCKDCLERARVSRDNDGFTWEELVKLGFPGENTECMVHCRCHVRPVKAKVAPPVAPTEYAPEPTEGVAQIIDYLGGPGLKVRMPAAGVPSVGLTPELLASILKGAPNSDVLAHTAMALPVVPYVLQKPDMILPYGDDARLYIGSGLTLKVERDDRGLWMLYGVFMGIPQTLFGGPAGMGLMALSEVPHAPGCACGRP